MSLLGDPTIKLFGKTIPLSPPKASLAGSELAGRVQLDVCDDESSKEVDVAGDFDEKNDVEEAMDDHQGESSHKGLKDASGSSGIIDLDVEGSSNEGLKNNDQSGDTSGVVDGKTLKKPDKILPCPRCNSMDTKFCYYNNYNVNQPRHFCKKCQRYWTAGGSMRNVPVGSGRRKSKSTASNGSISRQVLVNEASMQMNQCSEREANGVLRFGTDAPLCDSMASVLNLAENKKNFGHNGSEPNESQDVMNLQVPFYPQWGTPWNPVMQGTQMGLAGYPVACYSMQNYWTSGMMRSWIHPSLVSPSTHNASNSTPNSPTLGKHSRDGSDEKVAPSEPRATRGIWIPKTLRIDDPSQAAKSSIWETLGIQNEKSSINEGGIFRGNYKVPERTRHMHTNPAAMSRSQNFHETTAMKQTSS